MRTLPWKDEIFGAILSIFYVMCSNSPSFLWYEVYRRRTQHITSPNRGLDLGLSSVPWHQGTTTIQVSVPFLSSFSCKMSIPRQEIERRFSSFETTRLLWEPKGLSTFCTRIKGKTKQNKTTTKQINKQRIVNFVAWQQAEEMISTNFPLNTTEKKNHGYKGGVGDKEA